MWYCACDCFKEEFLASFRLYESSKVGVEDKADGFMTRGESSTSAPKYSSSLGEIGKGKFKACGQGSFPHPVSFESLLVLSQPRLRSQIRLAKSLEAIRLFAWLLRQSQHVGWEYVVSSHLVIIRCCMKSCESRCRPFRNSSSTGRKSRRSSLCMVLRVFDSAWRRKATGEGKRSHVNGSPTRTWKIWCRRATLWAISQYLGGNSRGNPVNIMLWVHCGRPGPYRRRVALIARRPADFFL
jgi:hypothetical protein